MTAGSGGGHEAAWTAAQRDVVAAIDAYLQATEDRDLTTAHGMLAENADLVFPAATRFGDLQAMATAAAGRYRWIRKHRDHYAIGSDEQGRLVITSRGRLYGENLDGRRFDDVRYVDVFVLDEGRIVEQHVWNDLAETGVLDRTR